MNSQPPPVSLCRLALCSPFLGWQFIALSRRLANTGPLEDFRCLRDIRTRNSRGEVVRSPQCRQFFRHRNIDQLVKRHPFSFRELTRFFQEPPSIDPAREIEAAAPQLAAKQELSGETKPDEAPLAVTYAQRRKLKQVQKALVNLADRIGDLITCVG